MAKGKRIRKAADGIDRAHFYPLAEAVKMVKSRASAKFDETIEVSLNLNLDVRKAEQLLRGTVMLPHGSGKSLRVAVFAKGPRADEAKAAGAPHEGPPGKWQKVESRPKQIKTRKTPPQG